MINNNNNFMNSIYLYRKAHKLALLFINIVEIE